MLNLIRPAISHSAALVLSGCMALHGHALAAASDVEEHIAAATAAVGEREDLRDIAGVLCSDPKERKQRGAAMFAKMGLQPGDMADASKLQQPPAKVFDNLYFLGGKSVNAWAVATSAGIILIDSVHAADVEKQVVGGMRQLGLDPAQIKYVLITHGHSDHYGGAKYLQQTFGARVVMSDADWKYARDRYEKGSSEKRLEELPRQDMIAGDKLTLGDTTITIVPTAGHTPGTISMLIPVTDHGRKHVAAMIGGGYPNARYGSEEFVAAMTQSVASAARFAEATRAAGADIVLSNHPANDGSIGKMAQLAQRRADAAHPFVLGEDVVQRFILIATECAKADLARNVPKPAAASEGEQR